jgi:hypothetical protein
MRALWITIAMSDSSAFHLTLAHASQFLAEAGETSESMKHYTTSVRTVSRRLRDPVDGISDGIIGTILGFVCYDVRASDPCGARPKLIETAVYRRQLGQMAIAHERLAEDTPSSRWYKRTTRILHLANDCLLVTPSSGIASFVQGADRGQG